MTLETNWRIKFGEELRQIPLLSPDMERLRGLEMNNRLRKQSANHTQIEDLLVKLAFPSSPLTPEKRGRMVTDLNRLRAKVARRRSFVSHS